MDERPSGSTIGENAMNLRIYRLLAIAAPPRQNVRTPHLIEHHELAVFNEGVEMTTARIDGFSRPQSGAGTQPAAISPFEGQRRTRKQLVRPVAARRRLRLDGERSRGSYPDIDVTNRVTAALRNRQSGSTTR